MKTMITSMKQWMKTGAREVRKTSAVKGLLAGVLLSLAAPVSAQEFDHAHADYDALLRKHVENGRVDYRALKKSPQALKGYLDSLAEVSERQFKQWSEARQLAFYFNLYNAATLKLIVDHYPVDSIKDIGGWFKGPWDQEVVRLFGETITLDNLEHDIIREEYDEPRLHMALVCAAKGCPNLRSEAYVGEKLDEQLDDQVRRFLASPKGMRVDRRRDRVHVSSIFKWYGEDFVGKYTPRTGFNGLDKTERAVANFCAQYTSKANQAYLKAGDYKIKYLDYDWSLNGKE